MLGVAEPSSGLENRERYAFGLHELGLPSRMPLNTEKKQELINSHQTHATDTGSVEVQVAMLSERITQLTGHLQSNKAGQAVECFDLVQSVDSERLARTLDRRAGQAGRVMEVLLQVNTSGSESQFGIEPGKLMDLVAVLSPKSHLRIPGPMTIGAHSDDETVVRGCFSTLRELSEVVAAGGWQGNEVSMDYLSMGMSGDFEFAIAEGANLLRLGTAIFGSRST